MLSFLVQFEHHQVIVLPDYVKGLRFFPGGCFPSDSSSPMALTPLLLCSLTLALLSYGNPVVFEIPNSSDFVCTCNEITAAVSGESQVFFPRMSLSHLLCLILMPDQATPEYFLDISHAASTSSQASTCSVEPGSAEDVSKIVSYFDLTHWLFPTHFFIATHSRVKTNSFCGERWRTCNEPGILLD